MVALLVLVLVAFGLVVGRVVTPLPLEVLPVLLTLLLAPLELMLPGVLPPEGWTTVAPE